MEPLILFGILLACGLAFVNGLNDAAHSIATVVATRALSPIKAVFLTALCNMLGPFVFTTAVAATIGTTILTQNALTPATLLGIPVSSTHAINGAIIGVGATRGKNAVRWTVVREMTADLLNKGGFIA